MIMNKPEHRNRLDKLSLIGIVCCVIVGDIVKMDEMAEYFDDFDGLYCTFGTALINAVK
jgi:hypothetical protein